MNAKRPPRLDFEGLRKSFGLTQTEMAERLGMGLRGYHKVEQDGRAGLRHVMLAHWVSLAIAVERGDASLATPEAAKLARDFAAIGKPKRRFI